MLLFILVIINYMVVFIVVVYASFISFIGMTSVRFLMPFYLQAVLGYSPREVGLIIVPSAVAIILMGPLGGRLSDRYGWRMFNMGGLMVSATGVTLLSRLEIGSPLPHALAGMVLVSCGAGLFNAANNSSVLSAVEQSKYGIVSGFLNLVRNSANVTGIAMVTAIVTATMASQGFLPSLAEVSDTGDVGVLAAFTSGLRTAYLTVAGLIAVGVVLSFFKGTRIPEAEGMAAAPDPSLPRSP